MGPNGGQQPPGVSRQAADVEALFDRCFAADILKHITLNLIRLDPIKRKGGIKARRFITAVSDHYRQHLLGLA
jgi:hypothetical protein